MTAVPERKAVRSRRHAQGSLQARAMIKIESVDTRERRRVRGKGKTRGRRRRRRRGRREGKGAY